MELAEEIAVFRAGSGDPSRMLGEFRRAVLLAPVADGGLMSGKSGGVRWIYAFTDEDALARFALARDAGDQEWEYLSILGARLLDAVIPGVDGPTGVVVNAADGEGAMLLPPVTGIVPDAVAVDSQDALENQAAEDGGPVEQADDAGTVPARRDAGTVPAPRSGGTPPADGAV